MGNTVIEALKRLWETIGDHEKSFGKLAIYAHSTNILLDWVLYNVGLPIDDS